MQSLASAFFVTFDFFANSPCHMKIYRFYYCIRTGEPDSAFSMAVKYQILSWFENSLVTATPLSQPKCQWRRRRGSVTLYCVRSLIRPQNTWGFGARAQKFWNTLLVHFVATLLKTRRPLKSLEIVLSIARAFLSAFFLPWQKLWSLLCLKKKN